MIGNLTGTMPRLRGSNGTSAWLRLMAVLFLVAFTASDAQAQQRPVVPRPGIVDATRSNDNPTAGKVRVEVMVVYANNTGQVDPRLRELQRQLEMMRFTGFQVLNTHGAQLAPNQSSTVPIQGGRKMELTLVSYTATHARVRIELFRGADKIMDTTVSMPRGRAYLVGGGKYQEGTLMFPITVAK